MPDSVSWLPPAGKGDVEAALRRLVENWLAGWIVAPPALRVQPRNRAEMKAQQWQGVPGAMLGSHAHDLVQLGRDVCGGHGLPDHPADREILHAMGSKVFDDLASTLGSLCDGTSGDPISLQRSLPDGELFTVASGAGGWSLGLALAPAALIAVRKAVAGTGRRADLATRRAAIAPQVARLGCHLGHARLSAGEVAMLAAGDVIVFDCQIGATLTLTVEGHACASGKVKIVQSGEGAKVAIAERANLVRKVG